MASPSFFGRRTRRPMVASVREKKNHARPETHSRGASPRHEGLRSPLLAPPAFSQVPFPADSTVQAMLQQLVNNHGIRGIVVGLLDEAGTRRVFAHGNSGPNALSLDGESVFEIGSMTKVFTGILLADMVRRGEVELADPGRGSAAARRSCSARNGKMITLLDLTTHFSGLPFMPTNLAPVEIARIHSRITP